MAMYINGVEIPVMSGEESTELHQRNEVLNTLYQIEAKLIRLRSTTSEIIEIVENWENQLHKGADTNGGF